MSRPKRRPTLPSTLLLLLLSTSSLPSSTLAQEEPALTTDSLCDCYLLNTTNADGAVGTYFKHHRFFDFRNLPQHAGVPSVLKDPLSTTNARATSSYFTSDDFSNFWMLARWNNSGGPDGEVTRNDATVTMVNSPNNVYIEANTEAGAVPTEARTWLTLRTQRLEKFQTAAEIESRSNKFKFLSIRMHARTVGAPGAITAMFTYRHSDTLSQVQESDLEIRTSDARNQLHYTNQPAYTSAGELVPGATLNATMPRGKDWTAWSTHRMDWVPGETAWFVDGVETGRLSFQAPRDESTVILNAWSDGGGWTGNMSLFDAAYLQVQWVEVVFNSTDFDDDDDDEEGLEDDEEEGKNNKPTEKVKRWWGGGKNKRTREEKGEEEEEEERGCKRVCSIDETPELGRPVLLWEATESSAPAVRRIEGVTAWVPRVMVLGMVLVLTGLVGW